MLYSHYIYVDVTIIFITCHLYDIHTYLYRYFCQKGLFRTTYENQDFELLI